MTAAPHHAPLGLPVHEKIVAVLIVTLVAAAAWLRGGTHAAWSEPLPWLGLALLVTLMALTLRGRRSGLPAMISARDPVLWVGLLFLGLVTIQWWNAGRALYYDATLREWAYSPPRFPNLPSAVTPSEARQMIHWFLPAWVLLLALRAPGFSGRAVRVVWRALCYNAGIIALFGIVQYASGTEKMFGFVPMRPHFFATFGYPNHSGSYFLLVMCVAAGLITYELAAGARRSWRRLALLTGVLILALVGSTLSLSRAAIVLAWALSVPILLTILAALWPRLSPTQRVHAIGGGLALVILAAALAAGLAREAIHREFNPPNETRPLVQRETSFRWFQIHSALLMWLDHPIAGVGGWGYRYFIAHYVPESEWHRINEGKANVHNDPAQFLAEFGLIGAGAMTAVVVLLLRSARPAARTRAPLVLLPLTGAALVLLQSMIDLPFRSPAVLWLWLVTLAGAAKALPPPARAPTANPRHAG